jgi:outer membrane protein, heavy metal efflux system
MSARRQRKRGSQGVLVFPGLLALAAVGWLAAGCAHYQPRPISPAATRDDLAARRLDAAELGDFLRQRAGVETWPPASWDLRALTLAAVFYSPDLEVARARWGVARAGEVTAGARPEPALSVAAGYNATSVGIRPWVPEAALGLPVETAGKRGSRIAEAGQLSEAARLGVIAAAWEVRSRVRRAYVALSAAQQEGALLTRQRDLEVESVRILDAQLHLGAVSPAEVAQARIALDQSRLAVLAAAQRATQARVDLAAAIGVTAGALDGVALPFADLEEPAPDLPANEVRRRAMVGRSDLLAGLAEYEASQAALRLEIARQYPDLDIGAGYQLDQTDSKWTLSLGLTLPVFNRNRGPIAEAEARRREAAARFLALQSRVIAEIDGAVAAYRTAGEQAKGADELVGSLERRQATAAEAYRLGEISKLELVGAELELAAGELTRLAARTGFEEAGGRLEDAIQSPLELGDWMLETPPHAAGKGKEEPSDG